jgi:hypothetical protein
MTTTSYTPTDDEPVIDAVLPFAGVGVGFTAMLIIMAIVAPLSMMVG